MPCPPAQPVTEYLTRCAIGAHRVGFAVAACAAQSQNNQALSQGTVEKIKVHGKSLEGNLEGDSPDRDVFIRTIADRKSRGLAGHSMGGYGTVRMKHPEVFSVLYASSSCCLMNNPQPGQGRGPAPATRPAAEGTDTGQARPPAAGRGAVFAKVQSAQVAAWAPNPMNPPQYFDLPIKDGQMQPLIAAKYAANSPLVITPIVCRNGSPPKCCRSSRRTWRFPGGVQPRPDETASGLVAHVKPRKKCNCLIRKGNRKFRG